jgi:hypothetical protein
MTEKLFLLRKGNEKSCSKKKSVHYNVSASQSISAAPMEDKVHTFLFALKFQVWEFALGTTLVK